MTDPSASSAQVCSSSLAESAIALLSVETKTGVGEHGLLNPRSCNSPGQPCPRSRVGRFHSLPNTGPRRSRARRRCGGRPPKSPLPSQIDFHGSGGTKNPHAIIEAHARHSHSIAELSIVIAPQHRAVPSASSVHVWVTPAPIPMARRSLPGASFTSASVHRLCGLRGARFPRAALFVQWRGHIGRFGSSIRRAARVSMRTRVVLRVTTACRSERNERCGGDHCDPRRHGDWWILSGGVCRISAVARDTSADSQRARTSLVSTL